MMSVITPEDNWEETGYAGPGVCMNREFTVAPNYTSRRLPQQHSTCRGSEDSVTGPRLELSGERKYN